jgi:hypothetical protein
MQMNSAVTTVCYTPRTNLGASFDVGRQEHGQRLFEMAWNGVIFHTLFCQVFGVICLWADSDCCHTEPKRDHLLRSDGKGCTQQLRRAKVPNGIHLTVHCARLCVCATAALSQDTIKRGVSSNGTDEDSLLPEKHTRD